MAKDNAFSEVVIDRTGDNALSGNAWESEINLENGMTYFWKVKARSDKSVGMWSAISAFTTESALLITESAPLTTTPTTDKSLSTTNPLPQQVTNVLVNSPETQPPTNVNVNLTRWVIYGGSALLAAIVITLAVLVALSIRRRY